MKSSDLAFEYTWQQSGITVYWCFQALKGSQSIQEKVTQSIARDRRMFSLESQRIFSFFELWLQIQNPQKKQIQNIQEYSEYLALIGFKRRKKPFSSFPRGEKSKDFEKRKTNLEDLKRQKASVLISEYLFEFADPQLQRIEIQSKKSSFIKVVDLEVMSWRNG